MERSRNVFSFSRRDGHMACIFKPRSHSTDFQLLFQAHTMIDQSIEDKVFMYSRTDETALLRLSTNARLGK